MEFRHRYCNFHANLSDVLSKNVMLFSGHVTKETSNHWEELCSFIGEKEAL